MPTSTARSTQFLLERFSPKQIRSIAAANRWINLWEGAVSSGKTIASAWAWLLFVPQASTAGELVMIGKTRDAVYRNVLQPMMNPEIFGELATQVDYTPGAPTCRIFGRTVHVIGANDVKSENKIRGMTCAGAYVDEATLLLEPFFGGSPADVTMSQSGTSVVLEPGTTGTAWDALTGGTQLTDLTDLSGTPITSVTSDTYSMISFYGPDGVTALYLDFGFAGGRVRLQATDLRASITDLQTNKPDIAADLRSGGAITGDLSVSGRLTAAGFPVPMLPRQGRLPARRKATWSQLFQTGHGWTPGGSGMASSNANDTSDFVKGTQAVRVTTNGTAQQSNIRKTGMAAMDLTGKMIRLVFKVDDVANLDRIVFYVGTSNLVNYFQFNFHTHSTTSSSNYVQSGEWVTVHVSWTDVGGAAGTYSVNANGTPSTTTGFTDMSFALYDKASSGLTYHLQAVEVVPDTTTTFPNGVISITFDDSWQSVYDLARPKMDALGFAGTIYNIVEYVGSGSTRITLPEMRSLQNFSGWEMGGHSYSAANHGVGFQALTSDVVAKDFQLMRAWLIDKVFTSEHFAYPHGAFGLTTDGVPVDQLAAQYFTSARSIISETIETFAPAMPFRLKSPTGINDGSGLGGIPLTSMTNVGGKLDRCANNGDWLILAMHDIKPTLGAVTDATQISQAGFNTLMDAIAARGISVLPVGDVLRYYS